jgi:TonB family protein
VQICEKEIQYIYGSTISVIMNSRLIILFLLAAGLQFTGFAQAKSDTTKKNTVKLDSAAMKTLAADADTTVYDAVEQMPSFPGGDNARVDYLQETLNYPTLALKRGIEGRVFVTFIIEKNGSISHVRVLRGIGGGCDEEAVRVIQNMPRWVPGKQNGKPVRVRFNMPFKFTIPPRGKK